MPVASGSILILCLCVCFNVGICTVVYINDVINTIIIDVVGYSDPVRTTIHVKDLDKAARNLNKPVALPILC